MSFAVGLVGVGTLVGRMNSAVGSYKSLFEEDVAQAQAALKMQVTFKKQVQAWKDILLRGRDPESMAKYAAEFGRLDSEVDTGAQNLGAEIADAQIKAQVENFRKAHQLLREKYQAGLQVFQHSKGLATFEVDKMLKGQDRAPTDLIDTVVASLEKQRLNRSEAIEEAVARQTRVTLVSTLVLFVAVLGLAFLLVRNIGVRLSSVRDRAKLIAQGDLSGAPLGSSTRDELGDLAAGVNEMQKNLQQMIATVSLSAERIAAAGEELSATSAQQVQGAETQNDQSQQVASAMHEMSATVNEVSENATRASEASREAAEIARRGGEIVGETLTEMRAIAASVVQTAETLRDLSESSMRIGKSIGVIENIANQTNLLAFNAAIEAARAGEQGRGFAVVADEVRKLADHTTKATQEIGVVVRDIQARTEKAAEVMQLGTRQVELGVESTTEAGAKLQEIIEASSRVGDMVALIATAATEQASASEEINFNIVQIAKITEETSIGAKEAAKAVHGLATLATQLHALVSKFKLEENARGGLAQRSAGLRETPQSKAEAERQLVGA